MKNYKSLELLWFNSLRLNLTMKLTVLFLMLSLFSVQAKTYSQNTKITLDLNNVKMHEVFEEIESLTNFKFFYNNEKIDVEKSVSIKETNTPLFEVLNILFQQSNINYVFKRKQIILNTKTNIKDVKKKASVEDYDIVLQQSISGTITDVNGQPIVGVSVIEKNTLNGVASDFDGKYSITTSSPNVILVFSSIGFKNKEVSVGGNTTLNVQMEEDKETLDEVVVVAYGTATKKDLTGAVSVISSEDLNSFPATTVDQALQGKTSGVQITADSGAPGSTVSVNIRGVGSFGSTTPLYIVDGFPTQNISFLNPNNIESLTVLKDASATALYGVRASNGVVIIETKKGKRGKVTVEINSFLGFSSQPKFVDVLDVNTFAPFALVLSNDANPEVSGNGVPYSGWTSPSNLRNVNWQDAAFNSAFSKSTTINIRGGGEKAKAAFTAGIFDQEGTVVGSKYKRYDLGFNAQFDITEKLRFKADMKYVTSQNFVPLGSGRGNLLQIYGNIPHLAPIGDINGQGGVNLTDVPVDGNGNFGSYPDVGTESLRDSRNVIAQALEKDQDNVTNNILANMNLEYDIIDGLTSRINFGARTDNFVTWDFAPKYYRSSDNLDLRDPATFTYTSNNSNQWLAEFILDYNKTFAEKHKLSVLGGVSAQRAHNKFQSTTGAGFLNNEIRDISQAAAITNASGASTRQTLASTFARLNYSFDSKYYITGTIRRDGVGDQFTRENFWGVFPSLALGWNIDEEAFMDDSTFDVLKFRASWGETGNFAGIQPFSYLAIYNNGPNNRADTSYSFTNASGDVIGAQGLAPTGLPNPDLTWETQTQTNIGFEGELLSNRLYFTLDWFKKESSDFLFNETIPVQSGFSTRAVNAGNVVNKGLEFLVGYKKNKGDFTYDISASLTSIDNEITELTGPGFVVFSSEFLQVFNEGAFWYDITRSEVGGEVGSFYGFRADGIFQTQGEIDALNAASPGGTYQAAETAPGDRRFADLNGDGEITGDDRETIGSPVPDFYGSLSLNFNYKNFDLGLEFYGTHGNEILNIVRRELESPTSYGTSNSFSNVGADYFNNRWTSSNASNTYARALLDDNSVQNNRASSHFVEDGSYLRLRNLNFGYKLPSTIINKLGLNAFRIYLSAQNLITWTKYSGSDPEIGQNADVNGVSSVQTRGIDAGAYPVSSSVTLGFNLKF